MKPGKIIIYMLFNLISATLFSQPKTTVELKDSWYYINGEKFFIKAIGYEIGARPGQHPYEGPKVEDLDLMKFDLKVIKEGGYNTIRTWSHFSEAQLKLVQASGLKLIMGLEINPDKDFSDPVFVKESLEYVKKTLAYTKKYDCIITYLAINEVQTEHMYQATGKAFIDLMQNIINIVHKEHPGIPVAISANAMISDYINQSIFDTYAYNCYDHNEAQTATMGFKDYIKGLCKLNGNDKPFITTEFGYSVSQKGYGRYGGQTLTQQSAGVIQNYRDLIDAGAVGMCQFYYADGWWKGGTPEIHNLDQPEEWFGFWGYSDLNDKFGSPRPVWFAVRDYMKALIISPKNNEIYTTKNIPLELFTDREAVKVVIKRHDKVLYTKNLAKQGYYNDNIELQLKGIEDVELAFEFYDKRNNVIKTESILILAAEKPFKLPTLTIEVTPNKDLNEGKIAKVKTQITGNDAFILHDELIVSYNTHIGWEVGSQTRISMKNQLNDKTIINESFFTIPDNCRVVNASAGITAQFGKFIFKIHDQKIIFRGDWAKEVGRK